MSVDSEFLPTNKQEAIAHAKKLASEASQRIVSGDSTRADIQLLAGAGPTAVDRHDREKAEIAKPRKI